MGGQNGLRQCQQRILGDTCRLHRTSQLGGQSVAREKEEGVKILRFSTRTTERALGAMNRNWEVRSRADQEA